MPLRDIAERERKRDREREREKERAREREGGGGEREVARASTLAATCLMIQLHVS